MRRTVFQIGFLVNMMLFCAKIEAAEAYYGFLEEPVNPRNSAMGSAGTAMLNSSGFAFYNPVLPSANRSYVALEFGKLFHDLNRGLVEAGLNFPKWFMGISLQNQSVDFIYADERGVKEGSQGSEQGIMGSLSVGFKKEHLAAGLALNAVHYRIAGDYSYGLTGSVGALYRIIPDKLSAGAAIVHLAGRNTRLIDTLNTLHQDQLPMTARAGMSWADLIRGKIAYTVSADIAYSFNYEKLTVPVGIEAWVLPALALRLGKRFNHPTDLIAIGMGLKMANLRYDVAFTPIRLVSDMEMKWSMSLTYELPDVKKKPSVSQIVFDSSEAVPVKSDTVSIKKEDDSNDSISTLSPSPDSLPLSYPSPVMESDSVVKPDTIDPRLSPSVSDSVSKLPASFTDSSSVSPASGSPLPGSPASDPVDSTKTNETGLKNSSEKEIHPDSSFIQKSVTGAVADSAIIDKSLEVDSTTE